MALTFMTEWMGGTFVEQFDEEDLEAAILQWSRSSSRKPKLTVEQLFEDEYVAAGAIEKCSGVWWYSPLCADVMVNIVATAGPGAALDGGARRGAGKPRVTAGVSSARVLRAPPGLDEKWRKLDALNRNPEKTRALRAATERMQTKRNRMRSTLRRSKEMLWTFVAEFDGSTFIHQCSERSLEGALVEWNLHSAAKPGLSTDQLLGNVPVASEVTGCPGVWCYTAVNDAGRFFLVYIVATAPPNGALCRRVARGLDEWRAREGWV